VVAAPNAENSELLTQGQILDHLRRSAGTKTADEKPQDTQPIHVLFDVRLHQKHHAPGNSSMVISFFDTSLKPTLRDSESITHFESIA
jgi:hypothetical protein